MFDALGSPASLGTHHAASDSARPDHSSRTVNLSDSYGKPMSSGANRLSRYNAFPSDILGGRRID